jgi:glycine/D-amino acid oxidase-like deaminating enzyme/nitrite reductase/ring-hydroxylating ferredoxin subunit
MINRDGNRTSLWQDSAHLFTSKSIADTSFVYDVIIAGGGITGITTALLLQEAGKKCLVLEANNLCFGTTGGTTAHLNTLLDTPYSTIAKNFNKDTSKNIAKVTSEAIALVRNNVQRFNINCGFEDAEAFLFSQDEKQTKELNEIYNATLDAGLSATMENKLEIRVPFGNIMRVPGQAKLNPVRYVQALAEAFENVGGIIEENCRVNGIEENEPLEVTTSKGVFLGKDFIYATHIPAGVNLLHLRCAPWRSYALAARLNNDAYPKHLYYDMNDPYNYYRTQVIDEEPYLIVGGFDHKTGHQENTEKSFRELENLVRKHFDVKEISHKWSSQYFDSADGLPYIGHLPGHPNHVFVATGYGGNGITYSQVAAMVLRSMILEEETEYTSLFNPNRIKPVAGFKSFISHNADVVKQFVGKWFAIDKLEELADLAPGAGKVVTFNDQKIALYKEENGAIHAVSPACTHLKCSVAWNDAERSWDCPCHGARYSVNGTVLNGPAVKDLENIEVRALVEK